MNHHLLEESNSQRNPPLYLQETYRTIESVSEVLTDIITDNSECQLESNFLATFTCKKPPCISLLSYLKRIVKYARPEPSTVIVALILIDKLTETQNIQLTSLNIHRIILASMVISIKYNEDEYYSNHFYAKVGGISPKELNELEYKLLTYLDFVVYIEPELYEKYKEHLKEEQ